MTLLTRKTRTSSGAVNEIKPSVLRIIDSFSVVFVDL